jgi:hypothetical protein
MKKLFVILLAAGFSLSFFSCSRESSSKTVAETSTGNDLTPYIPLLEEVHNIECFHLKNAGIQYNNETDVYEFRALAFQQVIKAKDKRVLARYEDIYQKLADIEHMMNDDQKAKYLAETERVYKDKCN